MTSFVYIDDEIICQNGLERKRNDPQLEEHVLIIFIELLKKAKLNCKKMLDKPDNSQ